MQQKRCEKLTGYISSWMIGELLCGREDGEGGGKKERK